jgi:hypothetical protein
VNQRPYERILVVPGILAHQNQGTKNRKKTGWDVLSSSEQISNPAKIDIRTMLSYRITVYQEFYV